jgi:hypothetical protein
MALLAVVAQMRSLLGLFASTFVLLSWGLVAEPAPARDRQPELLGNSAIFAATPTGPINLAQASGQPSIGTGDADVPKNPPPKSAIGTAPTPTSTDGQISYKTPYEVYLTILTVALGIAFVGLFCLVHRSAGVDRNFTRHFIILTVIFAALFLIVAGYSERQTAPVFGLLGTIIGYLFGVAGGSPAAGADSVQSSIPPDKKRPDTATATTPQNPT